MPVSIRTLWTALGLVMVMNGVVFAQGKSADSSGNDHKGPVIIFSATMDRANETLTLRGDRFGSRTPAVFFETYPLTVLSATDTEVVTYLPASVPDGTYLFTVVRAQAHNEQDRGVFYAAILKPKEITAQRGDKGDTGEVGPAGPQGEVGPQGPAGVAGPKGDTGATGAAGATGATGGTGATGATGPVGPIGPQGLTGATGQSGPVGPAGAQGLTGAAGERGPQGEMGPQGLIGPQGATGPQGDRGLTGDPGPAGATGATGAQGAAGPQGPAGVAGPQGATGPKGDTGLQGSAGLPGPSGPAGPQGPAGVSGYELVKVLAPVSPAGVNAGGKVSGIAVCPAGKRVISGGFDANYTQAQAASGLVASASFPLSESSWQVMMRNPTAFAVTGVSVAVYAVCVSQ